MWLKTACHELEKWVPTSSSYRQERARADAELTKILGQTPQAAVDVPAVVDPDPPMGGGVPDAQGASGGAQ